MCCLLLSFGHHAFLPFLPLLDVLSIPEDGQTNLKTGKARMRESERQGSEKLALQQSEGTKTASRSRKAEGCKAEKPKRRQANARSRDKASKVESTKG